MDYDSLLEMLGINGPEEFEYFENFADLVETEEEVDEESLYRLFSQVDPEIVSELIENYFEDMSDAVPADEAEIYTLLENIRRSLDGLIRNASDDDGFMQFADELARFIRWYSQESYVECRNEDDPEDFRALTVRDALTQERVARLEKENFEYDFSDALGYELDDYAMSFRDMIDGEGTDGESGDILSRGYVYDDEMGG